MIFSEGGVDDNTFSRQECKQQMLGKHSDSNAFSRDNMISILRDHESGICMHGSFETTASMVSELFPDKNARHWMAGLHPCQSTFSLQGFIL